MDLKLITSIGAVIVAIVVSVIAWINITRTRRKIFEREVYENRLIRRRYLDDPEIEFKDYSNSPTRHKVKIVEGKRYYGGGRIVRKMDDIESDTSIYEMKKEKFINIANISFHFADKERIKTFYNDYFKEPTIKDLIRETVSETDSDIKASIPAVLQSKIGGKDLSKWISNIKLPDITETGMFKRYQMETIKKDQVKLGLEEDDIELSVLSDFEAKANNLTKEFGYQFDEEKVNQQKTLLKEKAAERTLNNLEKASDWVLIEGNFLIQKEGSEFYKISMIHPVSNYLASGKEVKLSSLIPIAQIEPSVAGNYSNSINKTIPLRIYGQVWQPINRKYDTWELMITPLAVY